MIFNKSKYNKTWQTLALEDLGTFKRGKSKHRPRNDKKLFENGIYPLVQTGEIKEANLYIRKHNSKYSEFGLSQSKLWTENTLCITIAANIAETAILGYPMCFPDSIVGFNSFENKSNVKFVYYIFEYVKKAIQNAASGSIQDNINIDFLTKLKFKIPEIKDQNQIAKVLSDLDAKIELNNKINAELEALAKLLYDYWFVQFDFPNEECKPYKSSSGKMVWNEKLKREIPEGWGVDTLSSWIKNDKSGDWGKESVEGNYTERVFCIRGADLNGLNGNGEVKAPERYILEKNSHKILDPHDLIVEISGGSPTQSTGRMAYITNDTLKRFDAPIICSNFCKAVSLKNEKYLFNFALQWNNAYDNGILFGYEGKTSGIKNLLFESFVTNYYTAIPTSELAEKFYDLMLPIEAKKQKNLLENKKLAELRDWLLPMLMNGQVTVGKENKNEIKMVAQQKKQYSK